MNSDAAAWRRSWKRILSAGSSARLRAALKWRLIRFCASIGVPLVEPCAHYGLPLFQADRNLGRQESGRYRHSPVNLIALAAAQRLCFLTAGRSTSCYTMVLCHDG